MRKFNVRHLVAGLMATLLLAEASASPAAVYTPPVTSNLVIQYDGTNYNATTGVWTNSGSYVGANTTAPGANKPTASTINGRSAVNFAATSTSDNSFRLTASYATGNPFTAANQATVFIIAKNGSYSGSFVYSLLHSSNRADDYASFGGAGYEGLFRSTRLEATPASGMPGANAAPYIYEVDSSNSLYNVLVNDVTKASTTTAFQTSAVTSLFIGLDGVNLGAFNGDIAQILIYNRTLSLDERNLVGSSLANFYSVSGSTYLAPEPAAALVCVFAAMLLPLRRRGIDRR